MNSSASEGKESRTNFPATWEGERSDVNQRCGQFIPYPSKVLPLCKSRIKQLRNSIHHSYCCTLDPLWILDSSYRFQRIFLPFDRTYITRCNNIFRAAEGQDLKL